MIAILSTVSLLLQGDAMLKQWNNSYAFFLQGALSSTALGEGRTRGRGRSTSIPTYWEFPTAFRVQVKKTCFPVSTSDPNLHAEYYVVQLSFTPPAHRSSLAPRARTISLGRARNRSESLEQTTGFLLKLWAEGMLEPTLLCISCCVSSSSSEFPAALSPHASPLN